MARIAGKREGGITRSRERRTDERSIWQITIPKVTQNLSFDPDRLICTGTNIKGDQCIPRIPAQIRFWSDGGYLNSKIELLQRMKLQFGAISDDEPRVANLVLLKPQLQTSLSTTYPTPLYSHYSLLKTNIQSNLLFFPTDRISFVDFDGGNRSLCGDLSWGGV